MKMSGRTKVEDNNNSEETEELNSLEYEEDCYFAFAEKSETPSFDIDNETWEDENDCLFVLVDEDYGDPPSVDLTENCTVEAEFYSKKTRNNKFIRAVRVRFQDLSKPYLAKITSQKNYTKFLQLVKGGEGPPTDLSPDSGINELAGMSPEDQEKQKQEWATELAKVEEEIQTLRHVLASKTKAAQELKRKLGFSVWREFQDDMSQGIRNVKESNVYQTVEEKVGQISKAVVEAPMLIPVRGILGFRYQKTESVIKATTEKTTSILGGIGSGISSKLGQLKNSESFRSFEEKVGSAYENVKTRVSTSRSNSMQNFDEALRETEARRSMSTASTPTISEERPS